jgi:hypothetical protein
MFTLDTLPEAPEPLPILCFCPVFRVLLLHIRGNMRKIRVSTRSRTSATVHAAFRWSGEDRDSASVVGAPLDHAG